MTNQVATIATSELREPATQQPASQAVVPSVPVRPLSEVIRAIRIDSLSMPDKYLDETVVPHGGE